jgi:hypothetical protein
MPSREDLREMWMGNLRAVWATLVLGLLAVALSSCGSGSGGDDTTAPAPPPVSAATAGHLAKLSNRVASDLDAGDTCDAAYAADLLHQAVESSDLPARLRPNVTAVATDLVNEVNCPPPPPAPKPDKEKPKPEHGNGHGDDEGHQPSGHSDHGGFVPPGHAKLNGEHG